MSFDLSAQAEQIYRFCRARCFTCTQAEDMAQEILLTAWMNRDRVGNAENPAAYLTGICRNVYGSFVRKSRREAANMYLADPRDFASVPQPEQTEGREELERLYGLVANLAREQRALIVAHYFEGKSIRLLSRQTGMPEGTVKWRLMLARERMKKE